MKSFLDALSNSGPAVRRYGKAAHVTKGNHVRLQDGGVPQTDTAIKAPTLKVSKVPFFNNLETISCGIDRATTTVLQEN